MAIIIIPVGPCAVLSYSFKIIIIYTLCSSFRLYNIRKNVFVGSVSIGDGSHGVCELRDEFSFRLNVIFNEIGHFNAQNDQNQKQ